MTSKSALQDLLKCPVCRHGMYPPIKQCVNGHPLCSDCLERVDSNCPVCCEEIGNTRCLALDLLGKIVEIPCKYKNWGCEDCFTCQDRLEHERNCAFRPYSCPFTLSECPTKSRDIRYIVAHLTRDHAVELRDRSSFKKTYTIPSNITWVNELMCHPMLVFSCFGQHFGLHFDPIRSGSIDACHIFIRFMGEHHEATRFRYRVEVKGNGRKIIWEGIPRSIRDGPETVRATDGLIVHRELPVFFSPNGDRPEVMLEMSGCIWEVEEESQVQNGGTRKRKIDLDLVVHKLEVSV